MIVSFFCSFSMNLPATLLRTTLRVPPLFRSLSFFLAAFLLARTGGAAVFVVVPATELAGSAKTQIEGEKRQCSFERHLQTQNQLRLT